MSAQADTAPTLPSGLLPWHAEAWAAIANAHRNGRLGHALLIAGPAGVGKRRFAEVLAAGLLCQTARSGPAACGYCRSCLLTAAGTHTDSFVVAPEEDKRDIAIDAIRAMTERLSLSAQHGGARVARVDPADALNEFSVNALLKTIEEPTPNSYLLLATSRPQTLPATLRSRCQRVRIAVPEHEVALAWLTSQQSEQSGHLADELAVALQIVQGAPLAASAVLESDLATRYRGWIDALDRLTRGGIDPLEAAAQVAKEDARAFIGCFLHWLRPVLLAAAGVPQIGEAAGAAVDRPTAQELAAILDLAVESQRRLERSANAQLAVESLLITWHGIALRAARRARSR
jgi:DNA polymerase-3 subunit delta'